MAEPRKPTMDVSGVPQNIRVPLMAVKETIEIITGARSGIKEIKGLNEDATLKDVINKVNDILRRINASGGC